MSDNFGAFLSDPFQAVESESPRYAGVSQFKNQLHWQMVISKLAEFRSSKSSEKANLYDSMILLCKRLQANNEPAPSVVYSTPDQHPVVEWRDIHSVYIAYEFVSREAYEIMVSYPDFDKPPQFFIATFQVPQGDENESVIISGEQTRNEFDQEGQFSLAA